MTMAMTARGGMAHAMAALLAIGVVMAKPGAESNMTEISRAYVQLVLSVGLHDDDYVDAYYGPPEWREEVAARKPGLQAIAERAAELQPILTKAAPARGDELAVLRHRYLRRQLESLQARVRMLQGERLTFDEESRALYDAVAPAHTEAELEGLLADIAQHFPGEGTLIDRVEAFRRQFVIPPARLEGVFSEAIRACRERTEGHLDLPDGESFTVEYVTGKAWSAYNWYQGGYRSLIQVNTDLPIYIDRAVDLACHEGYPGHHVYSVLLEKHLVRDRGWQEFSVYPLFSPQSLIAEGTANFGIQVAFPGNDRVEYERATLFPLAGLDPARAAGYYEVYDLLQKLSYAGNEAARRYLDGRIDAKQAADWLERYALMPRPRAEQRVRFIDQYRAYVINYNLGQDLVRRYIEAVGGTADRPERRWEAFGRLISSPRLPSDLVHDERGDF
jgi:hypothetical protein